MGQTAKENAIAEHGPYMKDCMQTQWNAFRERHFVLQRNQKAIFVPHFFVHRNSVSCSSIMICGASMFIQRTVKFSIIVHTSTWKWKMSFCNTHLYLLHFPIKYEDLKK